MGNFYIALVFLLLLSQRVRAQSDPPGLEPDPSSGENFSRPKEIIIVAVISILLFIGFYFIYLCCCIDEQFIDIGNWSRWRPWNNIAGSFRHSFKASYGLDPAVVKSFPTFKYGAVKSARIVKGGTLECAICLMEFNDEDTLRLIPICDHVFHADCVDDWLITHATCPVCRFNLTNADFWDHITHIDAEDDIEEMSRSRRMIMNSSLLGPSRLFGRLSRSLSTGNMGVVKEWDDNMERFTLRLPSEVRRHIILNGKKLEGNASLWVIAGESSSRAGYRGGFGEGSSRCRSERFGIGKIFSFRKDLTLGAVVPVEPTQWPV